MYTYLSSYQRKIDSLIISFKKYISNNNKLFKIIIIIKKKTFKS